MKITVIGLGLIGGSLAKALKRSGHIIYAVDKNTDSINSAIEDNTIENGSDDWQSYMEKSDAVIIAAPVRAAELWLRNVADKVKKDCIIADACSTKGEIVKIAEGMEGDFCFVGAHPMAGSEKSGYAAAKADLFENAYFIISPTKKSTPQAVEKIKTLAEEINAIPLVINAEEHDRAVAAVSHLPHIMASSLMNMVTDTDEMYLRFAAGGFRDVTRIAASDPVMWRDITFSNSEKIDEMTGKLIDCLQSFRQMVKDGDAVAIEEFFAKSKQSRDILPQKAAALARRSYECVLDIPDRVGVIAEIAVILGGAGINIKNLYVANSREFYGGVLVISFSGKSDHDEAVRLLSEKGFNVK